MQEANEKQADRIAVLLNEIATLKSDYKELKNISPKFK